MGAPTSKSTSTTISNSIFVWKDPTWNLLFKIISFSHKHLIKFTNEILGWDGSLILGSVIFIVLFGIPNFCEASYIFFIQINKFPHTEGRTVSCGSWGMFFLPCPTCIFIHLCVMARRCFLGLGYFKFVKTCPIWEEKENGDKSEYFFVYIRMIGCPFSFLSC